MNPRFRFTLPYPSMLLLLLFSTQPLEAQQMPAQEHNAADTIAFIIKHNKKAEQQCDELYKVANYYWNIGQMDNAQQVITKSKELAEKNGYNKGFYDASAVLGGIYLWKHDPTTANEIAQACLRVANKNKNEYGYNRANYLIALMAAQQGNLDSVIAISERVLKGPHILYDSLNLPKFNTMLANAYSDKGDYHHAIENYLEALNIAERTNHEQLKVICLASLATINFDLKNYPEALKYQLQSLDLAIKTNQVREQGQSYHRLANIYKNLSQPDTAIYYFRKAIPLFQQIGGINLADLKTNLGVYLVYLNQPDSGMYYLKSARREFEMLNDSINIAQNAMAMGDAWWRMGHETKNKTFLNHALKEVLIANSIVELKKADDLRLRSYYHLAGIYDDLGNEALAFHYLKKYTLINDTLRTKEYTKQVAEMQSKYESDKKETEIARLSAEKQLGAEKIARQKVLNYSLLAMAGLILTSGSVVFRNVQKKRTAEKQVAVLEKQNAIESMRTRIASDVHDEMGANLTRLGLNAQQLLQSPAVPDSEKQLAAKMSLQSKEIITGMREIIWASNPANDNLKSMLGFMRQYIDRFFDGTDIRPAVNFPYDVGEVTLHPEVRRNLFLILKESLNNAVKYSGSDRIDIDFNAENNKFQFTVKDYGKGLDNKTLDEFSIGMRNMKMRAEQIQSLFRLITAPGEGVKIIVEGKLY